MREERCLVCGTELPDHWPRICSKNGPICMRCEGVEIVVWHVTLPGEDNGFYDTDLDGICDMIEDADFGSGYTVVKEKMLAVKYHNLPEFNGF